METFEKNYAKFCGTEYLLGFNNGLNGLSRIYDIESNECEMGS